MRPGPFARSSRFGDLDDLVDGAASPPPHACGPPFLIACLPSLNDGRDGIGLDKAVSPTLTMSSTGRATASFETVSCGGYTRRSAAFVGWQAVTVSERLSSLATTPTAAVHHRCITRAVFNGLHGRAGGAESAWLNQLTRVSRRIRLTGLLRKPLQMQGFLFGRASPVHHEIRDRAVRSARPRGRRWGEALG
jgi:hypothetical protein